MRTVFSSRKAQIQADQAQAIGRRLILEGDNNKTTTFDFGTKHNDNDDDDDDNKWGRSEKFADCGRTCINGHHYKLLFWFLLNKSHTHTQKPTPQHKTQKCICICCSLLRKRKCVALVFGVKL